MDEQQLRDDLVAISEWSHPITVPDTDHLDAHTVTDRPVDTGRAGMPWQRALLAAAAVVLVFGGVWVLTGRDHDAGQTVSPTPTTGGSLVEANGWQEVPPAPLLPRAEAQVLFLSSPPMFVVFAGTDQAPCPVCDYASYGNTLHDAAAYDLTTNTWRPIADLPTASSYIGTSVVVGGEVYWMSVRDPNTNANGIDATLQKWSPVSDTWTEVALPTEVPGNPKLLDVDGKLLLYPGTDEVGAFPDQVFDGTTWTALPDDPITRAYDRQYLMVDGTLTLFAKDLVASQTSALPPVVLAASYDAGAGTWTRLADSDQLNAPVVALGATAYAPFGGGADGGDVANWGRMIPNGGSYSAADGWSAFVPPVPDDLMGVIAPSDDVAVFGVKGHVLHTADGTYTTIPTLPDALGDQFGQAVASGAGAVFAFGGGLSAETGGLGVHGRGFVWRPGAVAIPVTPDPSAPQPTDTAAPTDSQSLLNTAVAALGIDPSQAPAGALDVAGGTFCGYETINFGNDNGADRAARTCFNRAIADGYEAVFISQITTTEGDPVAYVWHADVSGGREYVDSTRDHFGSGGWTVTTCESVVPASGYPSFTCIPIPGSPTEEAPGTSRTFCDPAVKLLTEPDLGAVDQLVADLRAVDTTDLTEAWRGTYRAAITALEDRADSPDGYDTAAVTDAVNQVCGTDLSTFYATP